MARIGRSCIDRWEAHLVAGGPDGSFARLSHFLRPPEDGRYEARSAAGVMPQAYISRIEAASACRNAGKRLCRWLEWRRACQGPRWLRYPYGNRARKGVCNVGKAHLLRELFGADPDRWKYDEHFNSPELGQRPGFLSLTSAHGGCVSTDGVFDLVGNLHEWVSDMVTERFMEQLEREEVERREQPWTVGNGMFLGGFFSTTDELGPGCYFTTVAHEPRYHDYSTGFRCCTEARPEPVVAPRTPGGSGRHAGQGRGKGGGKVEPALGRGGHGTAGSGNPGRANK
jgi:formylglycine-generating enzyme required for sulfatase activity